jgi:hypothetical protein
MRDRLFSLNALRTRDHHRHTLLAKYVNSLVLRHIPEIEAFGRRNLYVLCVTLSRFPYRKTAACYGAIERQQYANLCNFCLSFDSIVRRAACYGAIERQAKILKMQKTSYLSIYRNMR